MVHHFLDLSTDGKISMYMQEDSWEQVYYRQQKGFSAHTIAWNPGKPTRVWIDEVPITLDRHSVLPIMLNQSFRFEEASGIIALQFDRNFYCLQNHDAEVGCYGFLFFGPSPTMLINLDEGDRKKIKDIFEQMQEEFESTEDIKAGMLRALLIKLVIQLTRAARKQYVPDTLNDGNFNLMRKFNFLVELHYKEHHQVSFYASALNRSPKTIANLFSACSAKTPLQTIHERIVTEAKRLLLYTDKSVKEIADQLGFSDMAHFSKFFRNHTGKSPSDFSK